jgi:molybdenum cofactor cytidylyltransferase
MIFDEFPVAEAEGTILAHSLREGGLNLRKGRRLTAEDVAALAEAGIRTVIAARLEDGDVHEDEASERLARAVAGTGLVAGDAFTGRVNLFATVPGLAVVDGERLDRINRVDEAITIATLPRFAPVQPKQMVATVKIIPFATPGDALQRCEDIAKDGGTPVISVAPFRSLKVGLIQTTLVGTSPKMLDKTSQITSERVSVLGGVLEDERRCGHETSVLAAEIGALLERDLDLLLIAGASAITDRRDVLPAAIVAAGGTVDHFGMPVDPGNLLLMARIGQMPVLGLPGCARSPKLNGFDWVLQRIAAGLEVTRDDIMGMGVGGLLTEIPTRPQPRGGTAPARAEAPHAPRIAAVVLAAGQSRRMGSVNKLLVEIDGVPMVARVVDAALASQAGPVLVVTGHEHERVEAVLSDRPVRFVHNPAFAEGLSTSLRVGLSALPPEIDGALVCLGDMPGVTAQVLDRLIGAYSPVEGRSIVVPTFAGKRGNPVLWDRRFFAEMGEVAGDVGARHLIGAHGDAVAEVEMADDGVIRDIDTPEALSRMIRADADSRS